MESSGTNQIKRRRVLALALVSTLSLFFTKDAIKLEILYRHFPDLWIPFFFWFRLLIGVCRGCWDEVSCKIRKSTSRRGFLWRPLILSQRKRCPTGNLCETTLCMLQIGFQDMVCWGSLRTGRISYECWPSSLIIYIVLPTLVTPSHARDNFIIFYASLFISAISEAGHWIMRICTYTKYY